MAEELRAEIDELDKSLKFDKKEHFRSELWLKTKIAKISIASNGKLVEFV